MQARIRPARPYDAEAIAEVHATSWQAAYGDGLLPPSYLAGLSGPRLVEQWRSRLLGYQGRRVWVADELEAVIGFASAGPARGDPALAGFAGELDMLYLRPGTTGRGLGARLLARTIAALEERGARWLVIWVLEGNRRARRFYERQGLRLDGARRVDRIGDWQVPVVRYARPINAIIDYGRLAELLRSR